MDEDMRKILDYLKEHGYSIEETIALQTQYHALRQSNFVLDMVLSGQNAIKESYDKIENDDCDWPNLSDLFSAQLDGQILLGDDLQVFYAAQQGFRFGLQVGALEALRDLKKARLS